MTAQRARSTRPLTLSLLVDTVCCVSARWLLQRTKTRPKKEDIDLLTSTRSVHAVRHYYLHFLSQLGQHCRLRQRVIATAQVFLRRFYTQSTLSQHDPALIAVTALLIAAKVEECAINAKAIVKQLQPTPQPTTTASTTTTFDWPYGVSDVLDCEFVVLNTLLFDLIVYHPYRPLVHFLASFSAHERYTELVQHSWELVNESYYSDVVMLYPPYVIAISCVYMAAHMLNVDYRPWIRAIATPQQLVADCTHQLLQHIDRREAMEREKADGTAADGGVDVLGCVLHLRLRAALDRLHQHHHSRRGGRPAEQRVEDDRVGDKEERVSDEAIADAADNAMVDAVVVLGDEPRYTAVVDSACGATAVDDAETAVRKKQKVDVG